MLVLLGLVLLGLGPLGLAALRLRCARRKLGAVLVVRANARYSLLVAVAVGLPFFLWTECKPERFIKGLAAGSCTAGAHTDLVTNNAARARARP